MKTWTRLILLQLAALLLAFPASSETEAMLVVSKEGLSPQLSFGKTVQGTISPDGVSVSIGGEKYPAASFGINKDGCFEVGIEQGIDSGVFENPEFAGTGNYEGESVNFSANVSARISAEAEICPTVPEPFQLSPEPETPQEAPPGNGHPPQRMLVTGVGSPRPRARAGKQVSGPLIAYCLDIGRETPSPDVRFSIAPSMKLTKDAVKKLASMKLDEDSFQHCVWALFKDEVWKTIAWKMLERRELMRALGDEQKSKESEAKGLENELRSELGEYASALAAECPVSRQGLAGSFTRSQLSKLTECWKSGKGKDYCIYRSKI